MEAHPEAELLIHPECGCASSCLLYTLEGDSRFSRSYYLSTEGMVHHAQKSAARAFIVATESGMVYRLRKEVPEKVFYPVSYASVCEYMKMNTMEKLLLALREDRNEILIPPEIAQRALGGIHNMLTLA
jgi:quinolinate synthase